MKEYTLSLIGVPTVVYNAYSSIKGFRAPSRTIGFGICGFCQRLEFRFFVFVRSLCLLSFNKHKRSINPQFLKPEGLGFLDEVRVEGLRFQG